MKIKKPKKVKDLINTSMTDNEATAVLETALENAINGTAVPAAERSDVIAAWAYLWQNGYRTIPSKPPPL